MLPLLLFSQLRFSSELEMTAWIFKRLETTLPPDFILFVAKDLLFPDFSGDHVSTFYKWFCVFAWIGVAKKRKPNS